MAAAPRGSERGVFEPLNQDPGEVLKEIKEQLSHAPGNDDWVIWGRWFLADRSTRTISPFSKVTVPDYVENLIKDGWLDEAEELAVGNAQLLQRIAGARAKLQENAANRPP